MVEKRYKTTRCCPWLQMEMTGQLLSMDTTWQGKSLMYPLHRGLCEEKDRSRKFEEKK